MKKSHFFLAISIILGSLYLISGFGKALNTTAFAYIIYEYHLGYAFLLAPVIPVAEIFLGAMLLLRIYPRTMALISVGFILLLTALYTYGLLSFQIKDCGCFGEIKMLQMPVWAIFFRNAILLILGLFLGFKKHTAPSHHFSVWKTWILLFLLVLGSMLSGYSFKLTSEEPETTHPWQGKALRETKLPAFVKTKPDSTYLVFVFSWKCYHCWNSIENIKSYKAYHVVDSIVGISFRDETNEILCRKYLDINFPVCKTSRDSVQLLTTVLPTMFIIRHDSVAVAFQSEIPSHLTLLGNSLNSPR